MRYARYRSDKPVRVLGSPEESRFASRNYINPEFDRDYYEDDDYDNRSRSGSSRRTSPRNVRGTTVREYRQRQASASRRQRSRPGRRLVLIIALVLVLAAGFGTYYSPLFKITQVSIEGTEHISEERIRELAVIPEGSTLLRIRFGEMKANIEAEAWVEKVEIHRSFPSTITITITERKPAGIVEVTPLNLGETTKYWLLSEKGYWLGFYEMEDLYRAEAEAEADAKEKEEESEDSENSGDGGADNGTGDGGNTGNGVNVTHVTGTGITAENNTDTGLNNSDQDPGVGALTGDGDAEQPSVEKTHRGEVCVSEHVYLKPSELKELPLIKEIAKTVEPRVGGRSNDQGLLNALDIINGCSAEFLELILTISAPDKLKTKLVLTNHVVVDFGDAVNIKAKEAVVLEFLAKYERIVYINVRVADHPSYRQA